MLRQIGLTPAGPRECLSARSVTVGHVTATRSHLLDMPDLERQTRVMRERPQKPVFGPESGRLDRPDPPEIKVWRSIAKAASWRVLGTIDTLILSYVLITFLGPLLGLKPSAGQALETASYIAITEVVTKSIFYFLHERGWAAVRWGTSVEAGARIERYGRTTTKTATWRIIASLDTMILGWFYTGNIAMAISIGGLEVFTKLILYFFHERIWARLSFGIEHRSAEGETA